MGRKWSFAGGTGVLAKAKVIATALPTRAVAAIAAVWAVLPYLTQIFPGEADTITLWAGRVVSAIAGVIAIIRKVTPVPAAQVGVLPNTPKEG